MQLATNSPAAAAVAKFTAEETSDAAQARYSEYKIIRRNGAVVQFEPSKIAIALTKAFLAVSGGQGAASARVRELVEQLTTSVVAALMRRKPQGGTFHIEDVQDQVELALMRSGEHDVARSYVLYRDERSKARAQERAGKRTESGLHVVEGGQRKPLDREALERLVAAACEGLADAKPGAILETLVRDLYDGVPMEEGRKS